MLWLSEILLQNHDLDSFDALVAVLENHARNGEIFFRMDVKPPFSDTPDNWEERLEAVFSTTRNIP